MKHLFLFMSCFLFTLTVVLAQKKQNVTLTKIDGTEVELEVKYKKFQGEYFFPEDGKSDIKGELDGEKVSIEKFQLTKVKQADGKEYQIIHTSKGAVVGEFITVGKINIVKMYFLSHGGMGVTFSSSGGVGLTMGDTVSKTISIVYAKYVDGVLENLNQRKYIKQLSRTSDIFSEYAKYKNATDSDTFEQMVKEYNRVMKS